MRVIAAGTRVRIKSPVLGGSPGVGTVIRDVYGDGLARVMCDCGPVTCTGNELAVLRDQSPGPEPMRYRLPYGLWTCSDGREVLFNREYKPIWERRPDGTTHASDSNERVPYVRQEWFYGDHDAPYRRGRAGKAALARCEAVLDTWGTADLPFSTLLPMSKVEKVA